MKITIETTDPSEVRRILDRLESKPLQVGQAVALRLHDKLPVPTRIVPHNKGKGRTRKMGAKHRRKCLLCGRGFLSKRTTARFCHRPCMRHHVGTPLGNRLAKTSGRRGKKPFTAKQLAAVRKNVEIARKVKLERVREAKKAKVKGTTLIPGDPLTPGLNP